MTAHALLLSSEGKKSQELADIFNVTQRTIFQWFKDFKELGMNSLAQQSDRGRKSKLSSSKDLEIKKKIYRHYNFSLKKGVMDIYYFDESGFLYQFEDSIVLLTFSHWKFF